MSQLNQIPGLVVIPDVPLFCVTMILLAAITACSAWLLLHEKDFRQEKKDFEKEMDEAYEHLSSYVEISAQGLLSDKWEHMYDAFTPYTCVLCGRNYLQFPYRVYRDNQKPDNTIMFGSHVCQAIRDLSPSETRMLAREYEEDNQEFMKRFRLGELPTTLIPALAMGPSPLEKEEDAITLRQQRAIRIPRLYSFFPEE